MTLCDAGPLVALIARDDQHHDRCVAALKRLPPSPLVVTWPRLTEAAGWHAWNGRGRVGEGASGTPPLRSGTCHPTPPAKPGKLAAQVPGRLDPGFATP